MRREYGLALAALMAMSVASAPLQAAAQAGPAAPASPAAAEFAGPSIPGVCLLGQQELLSGSKVGIATATRLEQLQQQVQSDLMARKASIEAAAKALQAQAPTLSPAQGAQKQRALGQRAQALQTAAAQRSQQLDATRAKALQRIKDESKPLILAAMAEAGLG